MIAVCTVAVANTVVHVYKYTLIHKPRVLGEYPSLGPHFFTSSDPSCWHHRCENLALWHTDSTHTTLYLNAASRSIDSGVFSCDCADDTHF